MRYIFLFIFLLGGLALKFHFEDEELHSYKYSGEETRKSLLNGINKNKLQLENHPQVLTGFTPSEDSSDQEIPNKQELTDIAEEHQRGLEEIESEEEYKQKIQQKITENGSDFISLNKKRQRDRK